MVGCCSNSGDCSCVRWGSAKVSSVEIVTQGQIGTEYRYSVLVL